MLQGYINRKTLVVFLIALLMGFGAGYGYLYLTEPEPVERFNTAALTAGLKYSKAEAGKFRCSVLVDRAAMYNIPSALQGRIIERMSMGVQVEYLETVSSQDKDENYAVLTEDVSFRRFFGRRRTVPAGTQVLVLQRDDGDGESRIRAVVDGDEYVLNVDTVLLRFPYLGQWKRIEFNGKPGYMQYNTLSDSRLM